MQFRINILKVLFFLYVLCILVSFFSIGCGYRKMEPEIHVVPSGYIGMVYVIFNQLDGFSEEYDINDSRVYRIPKSGILKTKFKENYGWIDADENIKLYYQSDDSLMRIDINFSGSEFRNIDSNQIIFFHYGYGGAKSDFGYEGEVLSYIVDSFKNISKRDYILTKDNFENWNN